MERVSDDSQTTLFVDQIDAALHAQSRRDLLLNKEAQQVSFFRGHLFANDKVKAIRAIAPEVAGAQGPINHVVVSDSDHIQSGIMLHMIKNLLNGSTTIAVSAMHMYIGLAMFASMECLL